jgi:predicted GNAT superfamily acetyltransferase
MLGVRTIAHRSKPVECGNASRCSQIAITRPTHGALGEWVESECLGDLLCAGEQICGDLRFECGAVDTATDGPTRLGMTQRPISNVRIDTFLLATGPRADVHRELCFCWDRVGCGSRVQHRWRNGCAFIQVPPGDRFGEEVCGFERGIDSTFGFQARMSSATDEGQVVPRCSFALGLQGAVRGWFEDEYRTTLSDCIGNHLARGKRSGFLIRSKEHADRAAGARAGHSQCSPALNHTGLHVEHAWSGHPITMHREWDAIQRSQRPDSVHMPEQQDARARRPPPPYRSATVFLDSTRIDHPTSGDFVRSLDHLLAAGKALCGGLDFDEGAGGLDHRVDPTPILHASSSLVSLVSGYRYRAAVNLIDDAWQAADRAQDAAGVRIRTLDDPNDQQVAVRIFDQVWPPDSGASHVKANLLRAMILSGGYVAAAYDHDTPVGAALALVGRHRVGEGPAEDPTSWHEHLHSHMAGVLDGYRNRSIGTAIKLHQRAWALSQGIDTIVWSFDPLVRRNARLNVQKLGTDVRGYVPNFYGNMDDAINAGDPSDRVFAWWLLDGDTATRAASTPLQPVDPASFDSARVIQTPEDIVELRRTSSDEAQRWRHMVREQFLDAFGAGLSVVGLDADGSYVLARGVAS